VPAAAPRPARRDTGSAAVLLGNPVRSGSGFSSPSRGRTGSGRAGSGRLGSGLRPAAEAEQPAAAAAEPATAPPTPFFMAAPFSDADAQPSGRGPARGAVWRPRRGASFSPDGAAEAPPPPLPQADAARPLASALSAERERGAPGEPPQRARASDARAPASPAAADAARAHAAASPQPAHTGGSGGEPDDGVGPVEGAGPATRRPTVRAPASPFASAGAGDIQSDRPHRGPPCSNTPAPASPCEARERRNGAGWPNGGPPQHRRSAPAASCPSRCADWSAATLRPARTSAGRLAGAPRSPFDVGADERDAAPAGSPGGAAEGGPARRARPRHSDAEAADGAGCGASSDEGGMARRRRRALSDGGAAGAPGAPGAPGPGPPSLPFLLPKDVDSLVGLHRE